MENWWKILEDIFCASFSLKCYLGICWWKVWEKMPYLVSLNPLVFKNIAYIGSWKHFVFVFVCVCVSLSLYLSFCKYLSRSLSSPDDKLSENIWFVWSRTSYSGDIWLKVGRRWRCDHGDKRKVKIGLVSSSTLDC